MQKEEQMSDFEKLINASDLIEWIIETCPDWCEGAIRSIVDHIDEMSSAKPEPQWIPCVDGNEPKANADCWISTNAKYVKRASYALKANNQPNGFIVTVGSFGFYEYGKHAKAWMPYTKEPEPYREEGETDAIN